MAKARKTIKVKIQYPNKGKEEELQSTVDILNSLLAAYVDLTLENRCLLTKTKEIVSKKTGEIRVRTLTNQEILTEIEKLSVKTKAHPEVVVDIKEKYPALPTEFRRSTINTSTVCAKATFPICLLLRIAIKEIELKILLLPLRQKTCQLFTKALT